MSLLLELDRIPVGQVRGSAAKFEKFCVEHIVGNKKYFGEVLSFGKSQNSTFDRKRRYDYVAAISSPWNSLRLPSPWDSFLLDFNSRLVVFEFKNYSTEITRNEVLITSKYLSKQAKRAVAIIITRGQINENAIEEAYSFLRESGKLILIVPVKEIINVIDKEYDIHSFLEEKLTDFLMKTNQ